MIFRSLRSKLIFSVATLVIGSGIVISLLEANRFSKSLYHAAAIQGEYLAQALALEATNKILVNDLIALQDLLNHQLSNNPTVAYLFVLRDGEIIAHTFPKGIPVDLIQVNAPKTWEKASFKRIVTDRGRHFLDIAWPILSGKAGVLRIGLSEESARKKISELWLQMSLFTVGVLFLALGASFVFIRRITNPLSALAEAAENIDEENLELHVIAAGQDEVGRLASSLNQMLHRIRDYTRRIERHALELNRAHRQTRSSFEIIKKIWAQEDLRGVSSYLIEELREMVVCEELSLLFFSNDGATLFVASDHAVRTFRNSGSFESALAALSKLNGKVFLKRKLCDLSWMRGPFESVSRVAAFPIHHENRLLGALLIPCPGGCECEIRDLEVLNLVMNHSSAAIERAITLEEERLKIQSDLGVQTEFCGIVGKDRKMQDIFKLIEDIACTDSTVLIGGESGTGKELVASAIHSKSLRKNKPFIVINCSAYPTTLLESELFGHEKGAFTGAVRRKIGRFEQAHGGTVFLDEIGEIPPSAQIKLLRALQTQKFERVGGERTLSVDVRILAATNKDLVKDVENGRFREDLYYRLNVIPIKVPPLRDRRNDIPLLTRAFIRRFAAEQDKEIDEVGKEAMQLLLEYPWPGNVRELENSIEHAVVLARGNRIEVRDLPPSISQRGVSLKSFPHGPKDTLVENEVRLLKKVLKECKGNKKLAAQRLGISRTTLYRKMRKYDISSPPTQPLH